MLAAVLYGKEDVRVERRPTPYIGDGEVLVRIETALTCGTDMKVYRRGYHARMIQVPSAFGHEFAGRIAAIGPGVEGFRVSMRVVAANSAPCGRCFYCRRGAFTVCDDLLFLNGAYAQYIKIPARIVKQNLLPIPDHVSCAEAAMVEPLACVLRGIDESRVVEGENVALLGLGPIGLLFVRLLKLRGARVLAFGRRPTRLRLAEQLGADAVFNVDLVGDIPGRVRELTEGRGADTVIECVGHPLAWELAIDCVRRGGLAILFGGCATGTTVRLDAERLHDDQLTVKSPFHHTPRHVREALQLIARRVIDASQWISHRASLVDLPQILAHLAQPNGMLKVAIHPQEND